jgi:hypothetical protein
LDQIQQIGGQGAQLNGGGIMRQTLASVCRAVRRGAMLRELPRNLPWIKANKLVDKARKYAATLAFVGWAKHVLSLTKDKACPTSGIEEEQSRNANDAKVLQRPPRKTWRPFCFCAKSLTAISMRFSEQKCLERLMDSAVKHFTHTRVGATDEVH